MANRNHDLDSPIISAAFAEFLDKGYRSASLRKIASDAGVTIGAIYTRYKTKDILFCSLVQPLVDKISAAFSTLKEAYFGGEGLSNMDCFSKTMELESSVILELLFDEYQMAELLLCRSEGSSLEHFFDIIVEKKIEETLQFFRSCGTAHPGPEVLKLLINAQFHMYFQIIQEGYPLEEARKMMDALVVYNTGGWLSLLGQTQNLNIGGNENEV